MVEVSKRSHKRKVDSMNANRHLTADELRAGKCATSRQRNLDRQAGRRIAAETRNERWESLSPRERLKELDKRLGKGKGAMKQRAKLAELWPDKINIL